MTESAGDGFAKYMIEEQDRQLEELYGYTFICVEECGTVLPGEEVIVEPNSGFIPDHSTALAVRVRGPVDPKRRWIFANNMRSKFTRKMGSGRIVEKPSETGLGTGLEGYDLPMNPNNLNAAQIEVLTMLAEEAGEVVQAVAKILRHGLYEKHPDGGPTNVEHLRRELIDMSAVLFGMKAAKLTLKPEQKDELKNVWHKKLRWTKHQKGSPRT